MIGVLIRPADEDDEEVDVNSNDQIHRPVVGETDADTGSSSSDENTEYDSFLNKATGSDTPIITTQQFRRRRQEPKGECHGSRWRTSVSCITW